MLSPTIQGALNKQTNLEFYSSYLYLAMSAHLEAKGLRGMAAWLRKASGEETTHAHKLIAFVLERGGQVVLSEIAAPPAEWKGPSAAFEATYKHECHVTRSIHDLVALAQQEKDLATVAFLQWYINEQVEEEAKTQHVVDALRFIGEGNPVAVYLLDQALGK